MDVAGKPAPLFIWGGGLFACLLFGKGAFFLCGVRRRALGFLPLPRLRIRLAKSNAKRRL